MARGRDTVAQCGLGISRPDRYGSTCRSGRKSRPSRLWLAEMNPRNLIRFEPA